MPQDALGTCPPGQRTIVARLVETGRLVQRAAGRVQRAQPRRVLLLDEAVVEQAVVVALARAGVREQDLRPCACMSQPSHACWYAKTWQQRPVVSTQCLLHFLHFAPMKDTEQAMATNALTSAEHSALQCQAGMPDVFRAGAYLFALANQPRGHSCKASNRGGVHQDIGLFIRVAIVYHVLACRRL